MLRDVYRITFTAEEGGETYSYELDAHAGASPRVVAHTAWHAHMRRGLPEVDFVHPDIEFLGQEPA